MPTANNWLITSSEPLFRVTLADCSHEHAESVVETLVVDNRRFPRGLSLVELDADGKPRRRSRYLWHRREMN
jgi:hypothetical protein